MIPAPTPAQVIVVDDHPLFRRGLTDLLRDSARLVVIGDFPGGQECLQALPNLAPDLILLDLQMPGFSGLDTLKELDRRPHRPRVVFLTASDDSEHLLEAMRLGADGYLMKDSHPDDILRRLEKVLDGEVALAPSGVTALARSLREPLAAVPLPASSPSGTSSPCHGITEREQQTLDLITAGLSNKLIARELGISDSTVKVYVKSLLRKLNLHTRLELAAWVHRQQARAHREEP